ncbi:MAG TPA: hypothetical protein DCF33_18040 [Saprospirales bacterium]|nr:hypothetical protein [Saprospirales bacterium]
MNFPGKIFEVSALIMFLGWIAKMHFIPGGDYLFRIGTIGIVTSLIIQIHNSVKIPDVKSNNLTKLFLLNGLSLIIVYSGMMLKVSHIMNNQIEKDFVLDFFGIPAIIVSIMYNFLHIDTLMKSSEKNKLLFYRQILLPWTLFLFSFLLYTIYSIILTKT